MMTYDEMMNAVEMLYDDACYFVIPDMNDRPVIHLTFRDFDGFDSHWNEIYRAYTNAHAVECFLKMLEQTCKTALGSMYRRYIYEDFTIEISYTSYNI